MWSCVALRFDTFITPTRRSLQLRRKYAYNLYQAVDIEAQQEFQPIDVETELCFNWSINRRLRYDGDWIVF